MSAPNTGSSYHASSLSTVGMGYSIGGGSNPGPSAHMAAGMPHSGPMCGVSQPIGTYYYPL